MDHNAALKGTWRKEPAEGCKEVYPDILIFQDKGIYMSELTTAADRHPLWDVGTYELSDNALQLSTANDRVVSYPCRLEAGRLTIEAEEGCELVFTREDS